MDAFEAFLVAFCHRVILSYKSTFLGLLVAAAVMLIGAAQSYPNHYVQVVAGLILLPFLAWRDRKVADGTLKLFAFLAFACIALSACGLVTKELGPTFGSDELACVKNVPSDALAKVEAALVSGAPDYLTEIEQVALAIGTDLATCAVNAAIADFEAAHATPAADAGVSVQALIAPSLDVHEAAIARGQAALQVLAQRK